MGPLNKTPSLVDGQFNPVELKQFITNLKDRSEISGWYLYDEPPGPDQVGPANAKEAYEIIKQEDPLQRPVALVVSEDIPMEYAFLYRDTADIMMFDYYPLDKSQGFGGAQYFIKLCCYSSLAAGHGAYWPVIQGSGTLSQFKYMVYSAVQAGAKGLFFYRYDQVKGYDAWFSNVYVPVMTEFLNYATAFAHGPQEHKVYASGDAQVVGVLFRQQSPTRNLLVLIHHGSGTVKPKLFFDAELKIKSLKMFGSTQPLIVSDSTATIDLADYDVKVFEVED